MDRIIAMVRPARIKLVDDTDVIQRVQVDEGPIAPTGARRILDKVKSVGLFGFWSVPPLDSEAVLLSLAGDRSRSLAIGTNHQPSRPTGGEPGDSGIFDVRGRRVSLTVEGVIVDAAGGPVVVRNASAVTIAATTKVTLDAPQVEMTGNLLVDGNLIAANVTASTGSVYARNGTVELGALADAYDGHAHTGVKAGTDTSGPTNQKV